MSLATQEASTMEWPYEFPRHADAIAADAERFRQPSITERLTQLFALVESGQSLMSARRLELRNQLRNASESAWQRAQREVLLRHG
jgi:hypothetical protein